jgi:hypothetical protein
VQQEHSRTGGSQPPGWYRDPSGTTGSRWWDGSAWTDRVRDEPPPRIADAPPTPGGGVGRGHRPTQPGSASGARTPTAGYRRDRSGRRRVGLVAGTALAALVATFLSGVLVAWRYFDIVPALLPADPEADVEFVEVRVPAWPVEDDGGIMPDVRGLSLEVALEVLADALPAADPPVTETRPWAGPLGTVIEQRPVFGAVDPLAISLVIAEAARVPEVAGRDLTEVVEEFEALGTRVEVVRRFEAGVETDTVLDVEPAVGEALPEAVTLTASERPSTIFLATVPPVEGRCPQGERSVDGTVHQQSLVCRVGFEAVRYAWVLNRSVETIEGVIGLPDDGTAGVDVAVRFLLDGEVIGSQVVSYGQAYTVDLPAGGGLRFEVEVWILDQEADVWSMDVVLADLRLLGGAEALALLRDGG